MHTRPDVLRAVVAVPQILGAALAKHERLVHLTADDTATTNVVFA